MVIGLIFKDIFLKPVLDDIIVYVEPKILVLNIFKVFEPIVLWKGG
jgi:hypothetical protein